MTPYQPLNRTPSALTRLGAERNVGDMADARIQIRPFADRRDYERMVDYKRYRTTPGPLTFEQDVNQYVLENPEVGAG